jgi:pectate lyase
VKSARVGIGLLIVSVLSSTAYAQGPPDAPLRTPEGFGNGGWAGQPFDYVSFPVSSCDDSGPGTLRQAIGQVNAYYVVFGLLGWYDGATIHHELTCDTTLLSPLPKLQAPKVLVDGRGSVLRGQSLIVRNAWDVIVQDLRFHSPAGDGISVINSRNVNIQHVTVFDAYDGSIDVTDGSEDVTIQDSLLLRPDNREPYRASTNSLLKDNTPCSEPRHEVKRVSYIRTAFVNGRARNPMLTRDDCGNTASDTTAEVFNNLVANWTLPGTGGGYGITAISGAHVNVVANYLSNPAGSVSARRNGIFVCHPDATPNCSGSYANAEAYVAGNVLDNEMAWNFTDAEGTTSTPFTGSVDYGTVLPACDAAQTVLSESGALTGGRDATELLELATVQLQSC